MTRPMTNQMVVDEIEEDEMKDCIVLRELAPNQWYLYDEDRKLVEPSEASRRAKELATQRPGVRVGVAQLKWQAIYPPLPGVVFRAFIA